MLQSSGRGFYAFFVVFLRLVYCYFFFAQDVKAFDYKGQKDILFPVFSNGFNLYGDVMNK